MNKLLQTRTCLSSRSWPGPEWLSVMALLAGLLFFSPCARADTTFFAYDALGRVTQVTYGDGTVVQYSYDEVGNRTGQVIVTSAQGCSYTLSAPNAVMSSSGGTGSVTVTTSPATCAWQAVVNPDSTGWVRITSGESGTGAGQMYFTVAAHSICSSRVGTLSLSGQTFTITQTGPCTLEVITAGSGAVTSIPLKINCGTLCSATYEHDDNVMLLATPSPGETLKSWSGCDKPLSTYCSLAMNSNRKITATFSGCANLPVLARAQGGVTTQYSLPSAAYLGTAGGGVIQIQAGTFTDNLNLNQAGVYLFFGGYDCDFLLTTLVSTITGTSVVSNGMVTMSGLTLAGSLKITGTGVLTANKVTIR